MKKALLFSAVCAAALASGALFAAPKVGGNDATPATPATPADPGTEPATPATPAVPATPESPKDTTGAPDGAKGSAQSGLETDFGKADANADGKITRDEARGNASLSSRFRSLDKNRDGYLSRSEYEAAASGSAKKNKPES